MHSYVATMCLSTTCILTHILLYVTHTSCSIGSKPAYISSYIHKLLPSCASLSYEEQVGLVNGKLLMLHSHTGEKLKLDQVCCTVYDISIM